MATQSFPLSFLQKAFVGNFKEGTMFPNKRKNATTAHSCTGTPAWVVIQNGKRVIVDQEGCWHKQQDVEPAPGVDLTVIFQSIKDVIERWDLATDPASKQVIVDSWAKWQEARKTVDMARIVDIPGPSPLPGNVREPPSAQGVSAPSSSQVLQGVSPLSGSTSSGSKAPQGVKRSFDGATGPGGLSSTCRSSRLATAHARLEAFVDALDWASETQELRDTQRNLRRTLGAATTPRSTEQMQANSARRW